MSLNFEPEHHSTAKPARLTYHHGDLKRALVTTASRLLEDPAVTEVSLRRVAREIGVSHVATYRHFASKTDLLTAVVERWAEVLADRLRTAANFETTPRRRLERMLGAWVDFALEVPTRFRMMADRHRDPTHPMALPVVVDEITRSQRDGTLQAGDPQRAARTLLLAAYGYVELALDGRVAHGATPLAELLAPVLDGIIKR